MKVYMLLDRSGSMSSLWSEAIGSINTYVRALEDKDTEVYLAVFDGQGYDVIRDVKAKDWSNVGTSDVTPRGMTPLFDAFGRLAATAEAKNDPRTILVVMTDGHENASREYSAYTVRDKIKQFERKEWPTVFLGANFDNSGYVNQFGANAGRTYSVSTQNMNDGAAFLARGTTAYAASGAASSMDIDDDTRKRLF